MENASNEKTTIETTIETLKSLSEVKLRVSTKLIDRHTRNCQACLQRQQKIKTLYLVHMIKVEEIIARDNLLMQLYDECCDCFLSF